MSGKNKESLFMVMDWKKLAPEEFHGKTVFVLLNQRCFMLSPQNDTNEVITETLQKLSTDHEEADTLWCFMQSMHQLLLLPLSSRL